MFQVVFVRSNWLGGTTDLVAVATATLLLLRIVVDQYRYFGTAQKCKEPCTTGQQQRISVLDLLFTSAISILYNNTRVGAGGTGPKPSEGHCLH